MANAVAEVELDNGRSAEIYIAADYEYENSLITVIERDEDGCQDHAYDSLSTQEWPLLDSFYSTVEPCHLSIAHSKATRWSSITTPLKRANRSRIEGTPA